jgi:hypothetical protein
MRGSKTAATFWEYSLGAEASFSGVIRATAFVPDSLPAWVLWKGANEGKRVTIRAEVERVTRSTKQNSRYWSLVVPVAAEVLSAGREIPLSKDQAHYVLKAAFIGIEETVLGSVPKSSKELSTAEFAKFCESVESWLLHTHGVSMDGIGE